MLPSCSAHWKIPRWQQGWAGGRQFSLSRFETRAFCLLKRHNFVKQSLNSLYKLIDSYFNKSFSLLVTSYIFYIDLVALEVCDLPTASEKALVEQGSTGWNRGSTWVRHGSTLPGEQRRQYTRLGQWGIGGRWSWTFLEMFRRFLQPLHGLFTDSRPFFYIWTLGSKNGQRFSQIAFNSRSTCYRRSHPCQQNRRTRRRAKFWGLFARYSVF